MKHDVTFLQVSTLDGALFAFALAFPLPFALVFSLALGLGCGSLAVGELDIRALGANTLHCCLQCTS